MRTCNVCKIEKSFDDFYNVKSFPQGKAYTCKPCSRERSRKWSKENPEQKKQQGLKDYAQNKQAYSYRARQREMSRRNAMPDWLTEDQIKEIENMYWLRNDLYAVTGEQYHVDHIVPLQGKNICGLHVPWNLQILPSDLNLLKGNKHGPRKL